MTYLQTGFARNDAGELELELELVRRTQNVARQQEIDANRTLERLKHDLEALRERVASNVNPSALLGEGERRQLVNEIRLRLTQEAGAEVLESIRAETANVLLRETSERVASEHFQDSRARLLKELEALGRRGNLNLALGAVTTVVGISLLGVSVFSELTTAKDTWSFVSHFVPRLTLVVLIELFAYFFLSLYRTSLNEIKYFQNELTNVEARQVALRAAMQANASEA